MRLFFIILLLSGFTSLQAQFNVSGKVLDVDGTPLVGVNISENETTNGTSTDVNGMYNISVTNGDAALIFSYTGYKSQVISVRNRQMIDVTMEEGIMLGEIQIVGSRSYNRTATNSPVPIDIIDMADINQSNGRADITQLLQYAAPSFNATKQSGSDGADHIDPASLRGLGPDQTLVLVNGKRRHQSSLINVFGTRGRGNTGTDLNAIPVSAIKRIEVLRDGASAQYGSDAISGVINVVLKDQTDGLSGSLSYGAHSTNIGDDYAQAIKDDQGGWEPELFNIGGKNRLDGEEKSFDGGTTKVELNYGLKVGDDGGFINFSSEYLTKNRTLRPGFSWRQGYGSAGVDQFHFMVNAAYPLDNQTELYVFGGKGNRDTDAYAFSRSAPGEDGDARSVPSIYPNGFSPHITSNIGDNAITAGVRRQLENGWNADFSHTYGSNRFHYFITGSNNASLGSASPTNFDAGGHSLGMNVTGLSFSKYFENIGEGLNIAFGSEYRTENFKIFAGEEASYATYDTAGIAITNPAIQVPYVNQYGQAAPGGSQGFPGYSPANEVDRNRSNFGIYGDLEYNATERFLISGALRYENYSDFGNTFNVKLASKVQISDPLSIRASVSSGFRAPSLAQIHYNLLFNNIILGRSERTLLASNTSTVAKAFGINPLQEEKAWNFAAGIAYKKGGFSATVDGYSIDVKDRIILTDVFDASSLNIGADAAQFFANGVDTRTTGVDIVLGYQHDLPGDQGLRFSLTGNINNTEIKNINSGDLNEYTFFGPFSQAYLEAAAPDYKGTFSVGYNKDRFSANVSWTQYSKVIIQDFNWIETPATNASEAAERFKVGTDTYDAKGVLDVSLGYKLANKMFLNVGAYNLLNAYPTQQYDGYTDQGGFSDSVQMGSDGMYLFAKLNFGF